MATPERFELPTNWFEASYSIQLSYGAVCWYIGGSAKSQAESPPQEVARNADALF